MDVDIKDVAMVLGITATGAGLVSSVIKNAKATGARDQREKETKKDIDGLGDKVRVAFQKIDCNKEKLQEHEVKQGRIEEILKSLDSKIDTVITMIDRKGD